MVSKCSQFLNLLSISCLHECSYPHKMYADNKEPKGTSSLMLLSLPYNVSQFLKRGENM